MVERAEDAALLLLLLEQGIDDDDNIIPNAVVVPLISFFRLKNKRVTASKSSSGKWRRGIGLSFFKERSSSIHYDTLNIDCTFFFFYLRFATYSILRLLETLLRGRCTTTNDTCQSQKLPYDDGGGRVPGANGTISASLTSSSSRFGLRHVTRLDAGCQ